MVFDKIKAAQELDKGTDPLIIAFRVGFQACIESVEDKGDFDLAEKLWAEHRKRETI